MNSLRSKRFRKAFRTFEAFFAFWPRVNWGERKEVREGGGEGRRKRPRPNFRAAKKRKMPLGRTENAYGNAWYAGYLIQGVRLVQASTEHVGFDFNDVQ